MQTPECGDALTGRLICLIALVKGMAVIVELSIGSDTFELGRILTVGGETVITLETLVPLGERPVPFIRVYDSDKAAFRASVGEHPAVRSITEVTSHDEETLYAMEWEVSDDAFLQGVYDVEGHLLDATGTADEWGFEIRFPTHDAVSEFQAYCHEHDVPIDVKRIFNPTTPDAGPWYGLTGPQREVMIHAAETGYYSIPRRTSTQELADHFDISDQAVTERLRRGIATLVTNTLLLTGEED